MTVTLSPVTGLPMSNPGALPPPELRAAFPELDTVAGEWERLQGERRSVRRALQAADGQRRAAEHADIRAAGQAHRNGQPDPGSPAVEEVDRSIRDLHRQEAILEQSLASAAADLAGVIRQHRAEWIAATVDRADKRRAPLRRHAEQWGEIRHEIGALESMARWLRDFEAKPTFTPGNRRLYTEGPEGARVTTGRTYDELLREMLTDAAGPAAPIGGDVPLADEAA